MNRKNYCWAESGFLMRPRFRVGFGLTSSGSGRVRAEPTRPDSISGTLKLEIYEEYKKKTYEIFKKKKRKAKKFFLHL